MTAGRPRGPEQSGLHRVRVRHRADRFEARAHGRAAPSVEEPFTPPPVEDPAPRRERADDSGPTEAAAPGHHAECYACPVGSAFATARAAEPEALDHLLGAVHEILQLARAVVDAADRVVESQRTARGAGGSARVRRIVVD
jgi:hypothetical protein